MRERIHLFSRISTEETSQEEKNKEKDIADQLSALVDKGGHSKTSILSKRSEIVD